MKSQQFSIKKRIQSLGYAWAGIKHLIQHEHNARIHIFASILVLIVGYYLNVSAIEWMFLSLAIGFVFSLEIVNTAFEKTADFIMPEQDQHIKTIKDLAAAAVLFASLTTVVIGLIIFVPKIIALC